MATRQILGIIPFSYLPLPLLLKVTVRGFESVSAALLTKWQVLTVRNETLWKSKKMCSSMRFHLRLATERSETTYAPSEKSLLLWHC